MKLTNPRTSPLCFQKYKLIISVGQLLICVVLQITKTDRSVLRITSAFIYLSRSAAAHTGMSAVVT